MTARLSAPDPNVIARAVKAALDEDLGVDGDITTNAIVPEETLGEALIMAREAGVIAGLDLAACAFRSLDSKVQFRAFVRDGDAVVAGAKIARVAGRARALLSAERVALNFLGRLSGIATLTRAYVDAVQGTGAAIADTRKTTPGLRVLEKYAVQAGGGVNHRFGLYDAVLIKDNHIGAAGGLEQALSRLGHLRGKVKIEVEVESLEQLEEALRYKIDAVLLDNMDLAVLRKAVARAKERVLTEASGGVTLQTVRAIAETGVDWISVGALTHSPKSLDLGLDWVTASERTTRERKSALAARSKHFR